MDFSTLQTELFAFGFDDWNDAGTGLTRAKRLLNESYKRICDAEPWVFLETTASGTAPLTVSDVRQVLAVTDNTQDRNLRYVAREHLERLYPDLPETGVPYYWYFASETQIGVYPANTSDTIEVLYLKNPTDLSASGDTPVIPTRFHFLIVLGAAMDAHAYKDNAGAEALVALERRFDRLMLEMRMNQFPRQSEPEYILPYGDDC